ncbi:hypothetical protein PISMIDRAFT_658514, partial [Pisolithus microcarpus 441]
FYNHNNKKAWMTSLIFEEYPSSISLEFFEPNMTSFVQPCDAGIICCFKALYHRNFCSHAIDLDAAGECKIYKISLLEAMTLAKKSWDTVSTETIKHCWDHTKIQPDDSNMSSFPAHVDPIAWNLVCQYAAGIISLQTAESSLLAQLGDCYLHTDWEPVLNAVMESEDDDSALDIVSTFYTATSSHTSLKICIPA